MYNIVVIKGLHYKSIKLSRYLKEVFNDRTLVTKILFEWEVKKVIKYLSGFYTYLPNFQL